MSFATLSGALWALAVVAVTVGVGARRSRDEGRVRVWGFLAVALLSIPWVPSPHLPIRVERSHYAGPDLLSEVPERTEVTQDSVRAAGWSRVRRLRRTQGATLLSEDRRIELRLPWLWALVVGAVAGLPVGGGGRRPGASRGRVPSWVAMVALGLGACGGDSGPSPAEARLIEVMEMRRTGDVTGIEAVFLPEGVYEDAAGDFEYRGVPEIAGYLTGLHEWASGVFLDVVAIHAGRESASAEWFLEGVQSGPIPGRLDTITGRRFRLRGMTLVELERGAVVRAVDYLDWVPFMLDMGAEIRWPGGGVTTGVAVPEGSGTADTLPRSP